MKCLMFIPLLGKKIPISSPYLVVSYLILSFSIEFGMSQNSASSSHHDAAIILNRDDSKLTAPEATYYSRFRQMLTSQYKFHSYNNIRLTKSESKFKDLSNQVQSISHRINTLEAQSPTPGLISTISCQIVVQNQTINELTKAVQENRDLTNKCREEILFLRNHSLPKPILNSNPSEPSNDPILIIHAEDEDL